ncbi:FadR/GntR family transcriptional regulator [Luteipulveratus halotolerans]|uniref:GntR family transcriptional regulator n=1 Tax=Luteipulveratus halotolerans TaxID=1631356 RepID=A0A0L6CFL4_9MICO|nr:FadR/GntR family transcriptional regulator [Luteipulveratus halotolerans]KNX36395.1 GntR family transcriptional regulator [Luteipulveratus halotolerans]
MQPVRRSSLIDQVTDLLRAEIADGRWAVGERIPVEAELVRLTGVGRNTVREAVQSLVHAGLLERRQGSGTYVMATSEVSGVLGSYLSAAQHREVLELRLALDVTAARLAAERRTDQDVEVLRSVLAERARARSSGDDPATAAADLALHRAVIAASGNSVYGDVYDSLVPTLEAAIAANVQEIDDKYDDEHEDMVDAIIERDPERASRSARCLLNELLKMRS